MIKKNDINGEALKHLDKQINEVHHRLRDIESLLERGDPISVGMIKTIHQLNHKLEALESRRCNKKNKGTHLDDYTFLY